jgi:hypothetical protein
MVSRIRVIEGWPPFVPGYRQAYVPNDCLRVPAGIAQVATKSMLPVAASRILRFRSLATGAMAVPIFVRFTPSESPCVRSGRRHPRTPRHDSAVRNFVGTGTLTVQASGWNNSGVEASKLRGITDAPATEPKPEPKRRVIPATPQSYEEIPHPTREFCNRARGSKSRDQASSRSSALLQIRHG